MTSRTSRSWLPVAAGLMLAFAALTAWVRFRGPIVGDAWLWYRINEDVTTSAYVSSVYQFFAGLGSPLVALFVTLAAATIVLRNVGAAAAGLVLGGAAVALVERPLALLVGTTDAAAQLSGAQDSYPSGHVVFATGCFGVLAWLGARHGRREVTAVSLVLVVLMGVSRVADRSHLPDEVLGGYLLGAAWLAALIGLSGGARSRSGELSRSAP